MYTVCSIPVILNWKNLSIDKDANLERVKCDIVFLKTYKFVQEFSWIRNDSNTDVERDILHIHLFLGKIVHKVLQKNNLILHTCTMHANY